MAPVCHQRVGIVEHSLLAEQQTRTSSFPPKVTARPVQPVPVPEPELP